MIFQSIIMALCHYDNVWIHESVNLLTVQSVNQPLFQSFNISISQSINIAIYQFVNISIGHYVNKSVCQYSNLSIFQFIRTWNVWPIIPTSAVSWKSDIEDWRLHSNAFFRSVKLCSSIFLSICSGYSYCFQSTIQFADGYKEYEAAFWR